MITTKEYKQRQKAFFSLCKKNNGSLFFFAPKAPVKTGDQTYPFQQDKNILYLSGVQEQNCAIEFNFKTKKVILHAQKPTLEKEIWEGKLQTFAELKKHYTVDAVVDISKLKQKTKPLPQYAKKVLLQMRLVKSTSELNLMKKAATQTKKMYEIVKLALKKKQSPLRIKAQLDSFLTLNQTTHAFAPIITTKGHILHNEHYQNTLEKNKLLLVDMGAQWQEYASDFTRTFSTTKVKTEQQNILRAVRKVKEKTITFIKPQKTLKEIHEFAVSVLVDELLTLNLLKGKKEDILKSDSYRVFFPHGIGHHVGLDTHDCTTLLSKNQKPIPLINNMVITVEPGIYFIESYLENISKRPKWKAHINSALAKKYAKKVRGVRDEDTVVITKTGAKPIVNI